MKKITITVTDEVSKILEGMCDTSSETQESVATAMLFDTIYEDYYEKLWEQIDGYGEEYEAESIVVEDQNLNIVHSRIADILIIGAYTKELAGAKNKEYVEKFLNILQGIEQGTREAVELINLQTELEELVGKGIDFHQAEMYEDVENNDECNCGHAH